MPAPTPQSATPNRRQWLQHLGTHALALGALPGWASAQAHAAEPGRKAGHLVIVGGAEDRLQDRAVLRRFIELSGGPLARIVLCTGASGDPEGSWKGYEPVFADLGAQRVTHLPLGSADEANRPEVAQEILAADGFFMSGGDQRRLMERLWETAAARAIHLAFHVNGCTVGGTSAGAAVMSRAMLAIGEATRRPEKDVVSMDIGLGLLPRAIVDQHFNERGRLGRLLSALAQRPDLLGVGIDEDTALVVGRNRFVEVVGAGNVTVVDGRRMATNVRELGPEERLEMLGVQLHLLTSGHRYPALPPGAALPPGERRLPPALHDALRLLAEPGAIRG